MTEPQIKAKQMLSDIYNDSEAFPRPEVMSISLFNTLCAASSKEKPLSVSDLSTQSTSSAHTTMRRSLNELAYALKDLNLGLELKRIRPGGKGKSYYYWIEQTN